MDRRQPAGLVQHSSKAESSRAVSYTALLGWLLGCVPYRRPGLPHEEVDYFDNHWVGKS